MKLINHAHHALVNLNSAKLRSFLALLGIWVGTASVVALMNFGQIATEKALEQFKALGTDLLSITLYQKVEQNAQPIQESIPLNIWRQFPESITAILEIAPYNTAYQPMSFAGRPLKGVIIGADEHLANIINIHLSQGSFVSFVQSFEHFCVIGASLAEQIQASSKAPLIGQQLQIGQALYTIIGVTMPWKENVFFNEDINQAVIIPIAGMALVKKETAINNAVLKLKANIHIDTVIAQIQAHISEYAPKMNVFIRSAKQIIENMENQGRIFTLLLAVIGGISLMVGGIGVMNVMLVSVTERRKEIGIRKAVGGKNSEIQALFLVESILLSLVGGMLGIVTGLLITWIIAHFSHWPFSIYWLAICVGFFVSVSVGIFFGYYPARRAAALEPVISLRSE
jgi:putative ABC transport system permease protein